MGKDDIASVIVSPFVSPALGGVSVSKEGTERRETEPDFTGTPAVSRRLASDAGTEGHSRDYPVQNTEG